MPDARIRLAVVGAWRAKLLPLVSRTSSQRQGKFSQFQIDELGGLGEGECPILTVKLYEQRNGFPRHRCVFFAIQTKLFGAARQNKTATNEVHLCGCPDV